MTNAEWRSAPGEPADQVDEHAHAKAKRGWDFSLNRWPNRLFYSLIAGWVINIATGINALGTTIAVLLFVLTTAIVEVRRRR